ncbi:MAG: hypothetical protein AAFY88_08385, partial [Acidobacteriota bacterium]
GTGLRAQPEDKTMSPSSAFNPPDPDTDSLEPETDSLELTPALETLEQALAGALRFLDDAAATPRGLVSLPTAVEVGRVDPLTPALALAWLPTLPVGTRRRFLEALVASSDRPAAPLFDGPAPLEAQAAVALAQWRTERRPDTLQRAALRLLAVALDAEHRGELKASQMAWLLQPILLAARLAGLRPQRPVFLRIGRMPRRVRPEDVVRRYLTRLGNFLMNIEGEPATNGPPPEWTLCLSTELWRNTTPWSAAIRAPLEVTLWERWRHLRRTEGLDALTLAALLIAAENLHLDVDLASLRWRLAALQEGDGGFAASPLVSAGPGLGSLGSRTLTTILVARALGGQPRTGGGRLHRL